MKKSISLYIIGILLVICALVSVSYAFYIRIPDVNMDSKVNLPSCAGINLLQEDYLELKGDLSAPISDAKALSTDLYRHQLVLNSTCEDLEGSLYLAPSVDSTLPIEAIKYAFVRAGEIPMEGKYLVDNEFVLLTETNQNEINTRYNIEVSDKIYHLVDERMIQNQTSNYELYLWVDYYEGDQTESDLNNNITMNKSFEASIILLNK